MIERPWLAVVALGCLAAAFVWGRSALRLQRAAQRIAVGDEGNPGSNDAVEIAWSGVRKDIHTTILYVLLGIGMAVASISSQPISELPLLLVALPVVISLRYGRRFLTEARLFEDRSLLERRAEEVLAQGELAP